MFENFLGRKESTETREQVLEEVVEKVMSGQVADNKDFEKMRAYGIDWSKDVVPALQKASQERQNPQS
jgi:flagellar hook-basal body complex protein FliE